MYRRIMIWLLFMILIHGHGLAQQFSAIQSPNPILDPPLTANASAWTATTSDSLSWSRWKLGSFRAGACTTATWTGGKGICFNVGASGDNYGEAVSPSPYFTLAPKTVYRIRARMNSSQMTGGHTPLWDLSLINDEKSGHVLYAMDSFYLDNEGSANAVLSSLDGSWVTIYWTPCAVQTWQWNNYFASPSRTASLDARLKFRVLDLDSSGLFARNQFGLICLQELLIDSIPIGKLAASGPALVNITRLASSSGGHGNVQVTTAMGNAKVVYQNGAVTITPGGAGTALDGTKNDMVQIVPTSSTTSGPFSPDRWPIAWKTGKIYKLEADLSAPDTAGAAHPWDTLWMSMESPTNEVLTESTMTADMGVGSPKTGTPQTYTFFYCGMNETLSRVPGLHYLRWRLRFGNSAALNFPAGEKTNTGGVRVHGIRVYSVNAGI